MDEQQHFQARVVVFPRPEIRDPQGRTIHQALGRLGLGAVEDVRAGKCFELSLRAASREAADELVRRACETLLANTVVEDYAIELSEVER